MRDDLTLLYSKLLEHYLKKSVKIDELHLSELEKAAMLDKDDFNGIDEKFYSDAIIMDEIDVINYEINSTIDGLISLCGISRDKFDRTLDESKEPAIASVRSVKNQSAKKLADIIEKRDIFIKDLKLAMTETEGNIKSLSDTARLKMML